MGSRASGFASSAEKWVGKLGDFDRGCILDSFSFDADASQIFLPTHTRQTDVQERVIRVSFQLISSFLSFNCSRTSS